MSASTIRTPVRPGETVTRPVQNGSELVNQIVYQTVYLTAKC